MSILAPVALMAGSAVVGISLLHGLRFYERRTAVVVYLGLAAALGWACTGVLLTVLLVLGASFGVWTVLAVWAALVVAGFGIRRRTRPADPARVFAVPPLRLEPTLTAALGVLLLATAGFFVARAVFWQGYFYADVWSFWIPKAKTIYFFHGLDTGVGGYTSQVSPDYPPLLPAMDAAVFAFAGKADPLILPLAATLLDLSLVAAAAALLGRVSRPWIGLASGLTLTLIPRFGDIVGSGLADETLAAELGLAALTAALWLPSRDSRLLVISGALLTAAALTKNEGMILALILALSVVAASRAAARRSLALFSGPVLAVILWQIWVKVADIPPNSAYHFSDFLHPIYLAHHVHRLGYGARALVEEVSKLHSLALLPLLAVAAAVAARRSPIARLALVATGLGLVAYCLIYWISVGDIGPFVENNIRRITVPVVVTGAVLLPLIALELGTREPAG